MHSMPPSHQRQSVSRPSRRTPGGLLLPLHATLKGRVRWQVLDERGVPEVPRTPSGVAVGPVEGVAQVNLITDLGLDRLAELNFFERSPTSTLAWRRRLAVGTGSTAPDISDTTLDNEVQRASTSGTFSNGTNTYAYESGDEVFRAVSRVTRIATMTADRNLTEFGLAQNTTGDILIRELLRDGGGTPITVSLLNGKTLRLDHDLTVEVPAPPAGATTTIDVEEYDAGNNLVATTPYDVTYGPRAHSAHVSYLLEIGQGMMNPRNLAGRPKRISSAATYAPLLSLSTDTLANANAPAASAYATGTYTRTRSYTVPVGDGNGDWYGYHFDTSGGTNGGGFVALFTSPATYTKVNTDTLRISYRLTWARA